MVTSNQAGIPVGAWNWANESKERKICVCESGDRWLIVLRQFILNLLPEDQIASILSSNADQIPNQVSAEKLAIVFWEVTAVNFLSISRNIQTLSLRSPHILQLAATSHLLDTHRMMLTEFGAHSFVDQPEQIHKLAGLIQRYFRPIIS